MAKVLVMVSLLLLFLLFKISLNHCIWFFFFLKQDMHNGKWIDRRTKCFWAQQRQPDNIATHKVGFIQFSIEIRFVNATLPIRSHAAAAHKLSIPIAIFLQQWPY